ncbi:MAG: succinate dehydrogenase, hydrophobic membrane anchor protein [Rhodospirillaceae bacterium]|nr:succinate dehydrogenase, hydrophobic membrane anchor protein [Rhodospirillaceae bacterium]
MSLTSPLNRALGLGSAKQGAGHWWLQRLTAVALVPLGLWLAIALGGLDGLNYAAVVAFIREPLNGILLSLTLLTLSYHSQLGVQVVVEDYVHGPGLKVATIVASSFAHVAVAVAGAFAVLRVAFGAPG